MSDLDRMEWQEDENHDPDELDCCEHGVGFDEECEDCEDDPVGCLFPGKCVMPGAHVESECATANMMEEYGDSFEEDRDFSEYHQYGW